MMFGAVYMKENLLRDVSLLNKFQYLKEFVFIVDMENALDLKKKKELVD